MQSYAPSISEYLKVQAMPESRLSSSEPDSFQIPTGLSHGRNDATDSLTRLDKTIDRGFAQQRADMLRLHARQDAREAMFKKNFERLFRLLEPKAGESDAKSSRT